MRIYTRRGDDGETGLFGGDRRPKSDARIVAYGEIDELNAHLGLAAAGAVDEATRRRLDTVQEDLFAIGAHLATEPRDGRKVPELPPLPAGRTADMEGWIDEATEVTGTLKHFILPGGSESAARLHVARTVCRRAERSVVALASRSAVDPGILAYLNRLSDYLFAAARLENHRAGRGDVEWKG